MRAGFERDLLAGDANVTIGDDGETYIAGTQRADGSWRKPRRVKSGYVPQEEVPVYQAKGRRTVNESQPPTSMTPTELAMWAARQRENKERETKQLFANNAASKNTTSQSNSVLKPAKSKKAAKPAEKVVKPVETKPIEPAVPERSQAQKDERRLKTVRRRLVEIEELSEKLKSGAIAKPEATQTDKIAMKDDYERELTELEDRLAKVTV